MKIEASGRLLRIYVGESDRWKYQPLYTAIVEAARKAGLSGATVFKGIEGYGCHSIVHAARIFDLSSDLPILIEIVDSEEHIRSFLPRLDAMIKEGIVTIGAAEIIAYRPRMLQ